MQRGTPVSASPEKRLVWLVLLAVGGPAHSCVNGEMADVEASASRTHAYVAGLAVEQERTTGRKS